MKDVVIIAGKNKLNVGWVRCCLEQKNCSSTLCKTPRELVDTLRIMPAYRMEVRLVIIEPGMWENINTDSIAELNECAAEVPFVLLDMDNLTFLAEDRLESSKRHLAGIGS